MNSVVKFINASNKFNDNIVVNTNLAKNCQIIFVEGKDDIVFYKKFLSRYFKNRVPKFSVSSGKSKVIVACQNNTNKNFLYIVDSDYDALDEYMADNYNIVSTTGYSMENFFFFTNNNINYDNIKNFFDEFFKRYFDERNIQIDVIKMNLVNKFKKLLNEYKEKTKYYYAYHRAMCLLDTNHLRFYSKNDDIINAINEIEKELDEYNQLERYIKEEKIKESLELIDKSDYLWLRGHDIFNLLLNFLIDNKKYFNIDNINENSILECANALQVPKDFKDKMIYNDLNVLTNIRINN